ncbi:hypothetical protein MTO96_003338 [Rhipicephalus appendiculatus]
MASEHESVAKGVAWKALLVLFTCFAVGLCRPRNVTTEAQRADEHLEMVRREARCKFPQPKTICVQDKYPNANKVYLPLCTVLHQCAKDTGCCDAEYEYCSPKSTQVVERTFFVSGFDASGQEYMDTETLGFDNHTECECRSEYDSYPNPMTLRNA